MSNIVRLARNDLKRMFSTVMSTIIVLGLVVMPSIFAWYNILACWDVFNNTGNLKVAVASKDAGYESELIPIKVNLGDQVIGELRANHQIDWVFTDADDAVDGAMGGRYYAAVVIPEDFSRDMLTFYSKDVEHAKVVYYSNEKKNAIAPKVTGQGADTISYEVNQVFAEKISEMALVLATSITRYADDTGLSDSMAALSSRIAEMGDDISGVSSALRLYGRVVDASAGVASSTSTLIQGVSNGINQANDAAAPGIEALKECATTLRASVDSMQSQLQEAAQALGDVRSQLDIVLDDATSNASAAAGDMRSEATRLQTQAQSLTSAADQLANMSGGLTGDAATAAEAAVRMIRSSSQLLQDAATSLNTAADDLESGVANVTSQRDTVNTTLNDAASKIEVAQQHFQNDVVPAAEKVAAHCEELASVLNDKISTLTGTSTGIGPVAIMAQAAQTLAQTNNGMGSLAGELDAAAEELASLADRVNEAIAANDPEALRQLMTGDIQAFSTALSAPVKIERQAIFPVENFGSAMTPLYAALALFIGSLLIMVAVRPKPTAEQMSLLQNPKPHQVFFGRFVMVVLISIAQSTLMALGNLLFLQVQVEHPWLFFVCYWVSGLVFAFIIYSLVQAFANLGKAVAVIMLIVQVTGCGGSFPLQIMPDFVQSVSPWLPATYVVDAMRAAMFGVFGNDFWISIGMLLLFLIPAALIGLVLRKPLARLMSMYLERVEESKLMA